jgi:hypothetical protein
MRSHDTPGSDGSGGTIRAGGLNLAGLAMLSSRRRCSENPDLPARDAPGNLRLEAPAFEVTSSCGVEDDNNGMTEVRPWNGE